MTPSRMTPEMADRTKMDWSANSLTFRSEVRVLRTRGMAFLIPLTTSSVEAAPDL